LAGSLAVKAVVVEVPMKLLLGASEIVAALYIDRNFVTRETTWLEDRGDKSGFSIGSQAEWDSLMKQVEEFQSSSLESPIQYAQFLWSEHKARLDKYESLLLRFKPVLDRMERQYGSIENAARKLREQQESLNEKPNL
jgi:hypothetical protein